MAESKGRRPGGAFPFAAIREKFFNFRQHFPHLIRYTGEHAREEADTVEVQELYAGYRRELAAYAVSMTRNRDMAEDLVQETFLRALTHFDDLRALDAGQCRAWLYKTARNLYIDQVRKRAREAPESREALERRSFEEDFSRSAVAQLVGRLPESERAIFILRYFEGYNARELGEIFSLPPATVRSRLASAKGRLRQWINL